MATGIFSKLANAGSGGGGGPVEGTQVLSTGEPGGLVLTAQGDGTSAWDSVAGTGDVVGPAGATAGSVAIFDGGTGKAIEELVGTGLVKVAANVASVATLVNADVSASAAIAFSKLATLASANILVGSAGNVPTAVSVTGDVTISNAGVTAIGSGVIVNADVNASAAIDVSKLAALTASRAVVSDGSGFVSAATTTATEIGYVNGVTSAIQTQLNTKAPTASPAFTTQVTFGNYHLEPSIPDEGNSGASDTLDWSTSSAKISTLTDDCVYTFSNPVAGGAYVLKLLTGAGAFTPTWPGTVIWTDDAGAPDTTPVGKVFIINFLFDGTDYWGSYAGPYTP